MECPRAVESRWSISGDVERHESINDDNFDQPREFWTKVLNNGERERLVENTFQTMKDCKPYIQDRAIENFRKVHADFGTKLRHMVDAYNAQKVGCSTGGIIGNVKDRTFKSRGCPFCRGNYDGE
ncbi:unnamed protein product [Angiostrongylus costaricensis]|uniref:Catalase-rel domain-containing protein n=1 Tax=Angiostrongylus costaricensis TaxID=334426 RepID=A0A0R3PMG7_ANGCS|nr:unnamed protein product [Angiostrongylus costaricensis]